ncbi:MAG TPA: peptide-methionine (R)-S-oxide reductase [Streptosporangiaceae bacterium]|nr:peptide-methionine (R)-S-oxide reductase [Streptosporangiaceae bacterium]
MFRSDAKFESGTGWPSFYEPAVAQAVELRSDYSMLMRRTEVLCHRWGAIWVMSSTTGSGRAE